MDIKNIPIKVKVFYLAFKDKKISMGEIYTQLRIGGLIVPSEVDKMFAMLEEEDKRKNQIRQQIITSPIKPIINEEPKGLTREELDKQFIKMKKSIQLREEVHSRLYAVDGTSLPSQSAIDYLISKGYDPRCATEFCSRMQQKRIRLFRRIKSDKERLGRKVDFRMNQEVYERLQPDVSGKIRKYVERCLNELEFDEGGASNKEN